MIPATAIRMTTTVLPGKRIEISLPELDENAEVELFITPKRSDVALSRYPDALEAEYQTLTQKKRLMGLDGEEQTRLETIKAEINAIDAALPETQQQERYLAALEQRIETLCRQIEALPEAS